MATPSDPDRLNKIDGEQMTHDEKRESEEERGGKGEESDEESDSEKQETEETRDGEDTDEDDVQHYWDCCKCIYKTDNDLEDKRCLGCGHTRCRENCMGYMKEEDYIYEYATNVLENTEAEKVARFPPEVCVQEGPSSLRWELKLFKGNARKKLRQFPVETMIPIYMDIMDLFDKPRTIRAVWNHEDSSWTYRSWEEFNKIPWAWMFSNGLLRGAIQSRNIYHPAPPVGKHDFPFFNYATDTLYLHYGRCGTDEIEQERLLEAMTVAGEALEKHQSNSRNPKLRFLQVTYCPFIEAVETVLACFHNVDTLERVTLKLHDHYDVNGPDYKTDWWNVHLEIKNGALKGNRWPVSIQDHRGFPMIKREGPFAKGGSFA